MTRAGRPGRPARSVLRTGLRYLCAALVVLLSALVAEAFSRLTGSSRLTGVFLSGVIVSAFLLGAGPGYLAAALACLAHLYLVDPPYRFTIGSSDELNGLIVFVAAAALTCVLAGILRRSASAATANTTRTVQLLKATREFSDTADEASIRAALALNLAEASGAQTFVFDGAETIVYPPNAPAPKTEVLIRARGAGDPGPPSDWGVVPLRAGGEDLGLAGWRNSPDLSASKDQQIALQLLADSGAAAIARSRLAAAKTEAETKAQAETFRNALLASISHDLRTPLSAIMTSASSLRRFGAQFDEATRDDLASTIEEEAVRLDAFVANLLQMTKVAAGVVSVRRDRFGIEDAIRTAVGRRAETEGRRLMVAAGEGAGFGLGDSGLFAQALNNVIENALRYSPADRPVEVTARVADGVVAVEVRDSGPGVPDADMARIFERFFRSETTQYLPGTGLGLAIAAAIMKAMDGTIEAQNLAGAGGLSVTLTLPAAARA